MNASNTATGTTPLKRHFGGIWRRSFLGAGSTLTEFEHRLACQLVSLLPEPLKSTVLSQFESFNMACREIDGRALNFYMIPFFGKPQNPARTIDINADVAPLVRITLSIDGDPDPFHAKMVAVRGRVFSINFSRRANRFRPGTSFAITKVSESWKATLGHQGKDTETNAAPSQTS